MNPRSILIRHHRGKSLSLPYRWQMIDRVPHTKTSLLNGEKQEDAVFYHECEQELLSSSGETLQTRTQCFRLIWAYACLVGERGRNRIRA
jgi:hypothetical protein